MTYRLHPEARRDLREAARFYREQAGGPFAQQFLAEFERAANLLVQFPNLGPMWLHGKRRSIMRRFPYSIIYVVLPDHIQILAVAHHHRHPEYWRDRE